MQLDFFLHYCLTYQSLYVFLQQGPPRPLTEERYRRVRRGRRGNTEGTNE
jgi:hypothetical protein